MHLISKADPAYPGRLKFSKGISYNHGTRNTITQSISIWPTTNVDSKRQLSNPMNT